MIDTGKDPINMSCCVFITSYEMATSRIAEFDECNFQVCIVDEAHFLKSRESKRTQKLSPLLQKANRVSLLTGTPILSRPVELFPLCKIVRPDIFTSFAKFAQRYCEPVWNRFTIDYNGATCVDELNYLLTSTMMIR